jgi:hypothetical protein
MRQRPDVPGAGVGRNPATLVVYLAAIAAFLVALVAAALFFALVATASFLTLALLTLTLHAALALLALILALALLSLLVLALVLATLVLFALIVRHFVSPGCRPNCLAPVVVATCVPVSANG